MKKITTGIKPVGNPISPSSCPCVIECGADKFLLTYADTRFNITDRNGNMSFTESQQHMNQLYNIAPEGSFFTVTN